MKISEKTKNYLRLGMNSIFILALISLLMACGSGGGGGGGLTSAGDSTETENTITGRVALSGASTGRTLFAISDLDEPYTTARIQLVDSDGNVVDETITDEDGKFEFHNVAAGDYTVVVIDDETGEKVTEVEVSVLEGDDVDLEGVVDTTETEWTVEFTSNDEDSSDLLENDEQMRKARKLAEASGVSLAKVIEMRLSGMGWGKIAKELGVHPSVLGHDDQDEDESDIDDEDEDDDKDKDKDDDKDKDKDNDKDKDKDDDKDDD